MRTLMVVAWIVAGLGCVRPNPLNCADGTCTDPAHPFCDEDGSLNGEAGTCIAVSCTPGEFAQCRGDSAITCDAAGTNYDVTACEHGCDSISKGCVACLDNTQCPDSTPTCDATTHECRACSVDADCASNICDTSAGTCHDQASVIYASPTGAMSGTCGDVGHECSLRHAFDLVSPAKANIKLSPGEYSPTAASTNKTVTLFGTGATLFVDQDPDITVFSGGHLTVRGLSVNLSDATTSAIACQTDTLGVSTLDLDRLTSAGGSATATVVLSTGCDVAISNSQFGSTGGATAGVESSDPMRASSISIDRSTFNVTTLDGSFGGTNLSTLHVTNSLFLNSGLGNTVQVDFSTIIDSPLGCHLPAPLFTNSILFARTSGDIVGLGGSCGFDYCLITPQAVNRAMTNSMLGVDPMFASPSTNDYHLGAGSPAVDAANPATQDAIDLDGTPRPQGLANDLGAYELH